MASFGSCFPDHQRSVLGRPSQLPLWAVLRKCLVELNVLMDGNHTGLQDGILEFGKIWLCLIWVHKIFDRISNPCWSIGGHAPPPLFLLSRVASQLMNSGNHFVGARTTGWIIWWLLPLINVLLANCSGGPPLLRKKRLSFRAGFWRKTRLWVFMDSGSPSPRATGAQFNRTSPRPPKLTWCDSNVILVIRDSSVRRISGHTRQNPRLSDARSYLIFFFGGPTRNPAKKMFFTSLVDRDF